MVGYFMFYLVIVNIVSFAIMGIDKSRAKRKAWRIPERILFLFAIIGGSIGSILGMYYFKHKTKHPKFVFGYWIILFIQFVIYFFFL
ncbi:MULTISPECIES: DUF1294 domain-containing protein [Bacillaceae]|uniref:DUF1294 domain-containing protein n=2 Tax=Bacillales TaxID=1385 RepID=UPI000BED777E|nr:MULTISPECIES: DUF1294 domain-containing protein [Bacillaceae]PEC48814.1 hypothetical protein CON00_14650 [Bacillus sp. AFS096315]PET46842.1 hypothetical protein CN514_20335 [Bacillus sp. AFS001701]PFH82616.1 hypothetical protein COI44_19945 [Bacillus sp. AFS088145]PFM82834.1 hypothetical protein COJ46_03225 [Bacillus sp. AFS077874]PGM53848.1 hypothetical protein CN946_16660 [Bacillus sp. AFS053548]